MIALLAVLAATTQLNLDSIKHDIKDKGVSWVAGETKFTNMSSRDRAKYLMKEQPVPPKVVAHAIESGVVGYEDSLPESFDWLNYQTSVKDQGECGSCWAFSVLGATESAYMIAYEDPFLEIDLSEQFALSCLPGDCGGGLVEAVLGQLTKEGVPDEVCMPYTGRDLTGCYSKCSDWQIRAVTISDWSWVVPLISEDQDTMKRALLDGPVVTVMVVYSDLWAYKGGVYENVSGVSEGFHAVELVGYENDVWIVKNSWGADWGIDGYLFIKQGQCGIASYGVQVYVDKEPLPDFSRPPILGCGCSMVY